MNNKHLLFVVGLIIPLFGFASCGGGGNSNAPTYNGMRISKINNQQSIRPLASIFIVIPYGQSNKELKKLLKENDEKNK